VGKSIFGGITGMLSASGMIGSATKQIQKKCKNGHFLKKSSDHPTGDTSLVSCDNCGNGGIMMLAGYFFRCEFDCNYDLCKECFEKS